MQRYSSGHKQQSSLPMSLSTRGLSARRKSGLVYPSPESGIHPSLTLETHTLTRENAQLQQARMKRMGLSPRPRITQHQQQMVQNTYDRIKMEMIEFVKNNFHRKECTRFIPKNDPKRKPNDPIKCHCGAEPKDHVDVAAGKQEFFLIGAEEIAARMQRGEMKQTWDGKSDIEVFPTNAFGKINFQYEGLGGRKASKYVRLKDDTPEDVVIDMLYRHWRMDQPHLPNLVITVIGGAKNFKLDGKKKEIFNRGLVNAAQTTHAWIITSGFNMGVMSAVGEAVADAQSYTWDKNGMSHKLRCIGIAPWGYVLNNHTLVSEDGNGSWNATYKPTKIKRQGWPVSLDPNHTHFLLVDDGIRGVYGGVAEFRARLERKLSQPVDPSGNEESGCGIPVVLVVVEGGYDAIMDVSRSIKARIPCVICEGTGRAADILAYAYTHFITTRDGKRVMKEKHQLILEDKLISAYGKTWAARSDVKKEATKFMNIVQDSCKDECLMTVFDMHKDEELDVAILSALLKGQGAKNLQQMHDQLKLALTWNRTDIAEEDIFTLDVIWPPGSLNDIMTDALIDDKVGFVRLLLQNGLIMEDYLTVPMLRELYNKVPRTHHLREMLFKKKSSKDTITLRDVWRLLVDLLGKYKNKIYKEDLAKKKPGDSGEKELMAESPETQKFQKPFRELFLWAILMNRQELAKFLWERGEEAIPSAIAASKIYLSMNGKLAQHDSDLRSIYQKNKEEFELLAVRVLDECNNVDPEKAAMLTERKYPGWGGMDCLEMAAQAQCREFLSTACCQNSLAQMWKRGIASHSVLVLFSLIFPPLIFFVLKFQALSGEKERLSACEKFVTFFKAPVTKFVSNVFMYILFLCIYSYMILFGFRETVMPIEWVTIAWMGTIVIEELRKMFFNSMGDTLKQRLLIWWNFSVFNRVDAIVIVLAIMGIIFRFSPGPLSYAKNVYSVMCVFLFVRVLREYSASSSLGPKLVMINEMLKELFLFIAILVIFLLAYGISSQALMHPIRDFYPLIFKDIFYYPYWQVYGELYLEELEGRTDDCLGNGTVMADGTPCPTYSWLVIVLTAAYLLVGNLLLLNILIAIFNNVFEEIHMHSIQIWKYGMYFLVVEYDSKPILAPPFCIFEHLILIVRWIFKKTCCKKETPDDFYTEKQIDILQMFEKEMVRNFVRKSDRQAKDAMQNHITRIHYRVDEMAKMLEEERLLEQQHFEAEQNKLPEKGSSHNRLHSLHNQSSTESTSTVESGGRSSVASHVADKPKTEKPKYWRWPSMEAIKRLKAIQEGNETDLNSTLGGTLPPTIEFPARPAGSRPDSTGSDMVETSSGRRSGIVNEKMQELFGAKTATDRSPERLQVDEPDQSNIPPRGERKREKSPGRMTRSRRKAEKRMNQATYRQLSEEETSSGADTYGIKLEPSPWQQTPSVQEIQQNTDEVKTKLSILEQRLVNLEQNTQLSLYNIEALLRNAIFQRPHQVAAPSTPQMAAPAREPPPMRMVSSDQVPIPVHSATMFQGSDGVRYAAYPAQESDGARYAAYPAQENGGYQSDTYSRLPPLQRPSSGGVYSVSGQLPRPRSAGYLTVNGSGNNIDVPPTHPPMNAFGSMDHIA